MNTYSDYANDTGLGFGFSSDYDDAPELRRVSDCGGSEIYCRCDDETLAAIEEEIASDDQCGPESDDADGSDAGLTAFWRRVTRVISEHCGADVWDTSDAMLSALADAKTAAEQWVRDHSDDDDLAEADLEKAFRAIFSRQPDDEDREQGLWSHLCAAVENKEASAEND